MNRQSQTIPQYSQGSLLLFLNLFPQEFDAADRTSYIDDVFALARLDIIKTLKEICINKSLMSNRKYRILIFFLLTV